MIRRRRPNREIHFSFDSFLDVVANVVGIILRLILVAWVGARSYKAFIPPPPDEAAEESSLPAEPDDPLSPELQRQKDELARAQAQLLEQLRQFEREGPQAAAVQKEMAGLESRKKQALALRTALAAAAQDKGTDAQLRALSMEELRRRGRKVIEDIEALRKEAPPRQELRYRTPVSAPVQSEEWMFECRQGRVTLVDIGTLLEDAVRKARSQVDQLRDRWQLSDTTEPVGPFRLHYTLERDRGALGALGAGPSGGAFHAGLTGWDVEPVTSPRGEDAETALAPNSEFRRVVDHLDPRQAAVTLWVYPDSFPLYRRLRDFLHERDVVVAGRPLPDGSFIAASRHGSASRGQ
jgi:multidrug efflux pump subunit AcrA (membrane-fusion protein)